MGPGLLPASEEAMSAVPGDHSLGQNLQSKEHLMLCKKSLDPAPGCRHNLPSFMDCKEVHSKPGLPNREAPSSQGHQDFKPQLSSTVTVLVSPLSDQEWEERTLVPAQLWSRSLWTSSPPPGPASAPATGAV